MKSAPTGEQFEITSGGYRATVTEQGATLRLLEHDGEALLDGFSRDALPDSGRGQVLAPWPNRLRDGRWHWDGQELGLPVDDPHRGNSASHGLVRWSTWNCDALDAESIRMRTVLLSQPGYPFSLEITSEYTLHSTSGLTARIRALNIGGRRAPVALGAHPYLQPKSTLANVHLHIPAASALEVGTDGIPIGEMLVDDSDLDFSQPRTVGDIALNHTYSGLRRDELSRVNVALVEADRRLHWWAGATCRWIQVYTGDTLDDPVRRRRSIAIEPMTAPPHALASGIDVTALDPGEALELEWGIRVER